MKNGSLLLLLPMDLQNVYPTFFSIYIITFYFILLSTVSFQCLLALWSFILFLASCLCFLVRVPYKFLNKSSSSCNRFFSKFSFLDSKVFIILQAGTFPLLCNIFMGLTGSILFACL